MTDLRPIRIADLFCGAGGTSTGALQAAAELGRQVDLVAVNHWPLAIQTHSTNHAVAKHFCMDLDVARPHELVPEGWLDILLASPSCTHFSPARGGRPVNDQERASAWQVVNWVTELRIEKILLENIPEFLKWGPVDPDTEQPIKSRQGEYFRAWVTALEAIGYRVEWRILNAADYGDATTRRRLFVQASAQGGEINWPSPTHAKPDSLEIADGRAPWRPAREIIDWSLPSNSIFTRKKPLAAKTLARIEAGLRKFGGPLSEAFIVVLRRHADGRPIDDPLPTITAGGFHFGLVQTEIIAANDLGAPPMVLGQHGGSVARPVSHPVPTIATGGALSVIEPIIVNMKGRSDASASAKPLPTLTAHARHLGLAEPYLVRVNDGRRRPPMPADDPLPTLTTKGYLGLCEPFLTPYYGTGRPDDVNEPLATATAKARFGLCEPKAEPASETVDYNLPTVVIGDQVFQIDIRFRMLAGHELAAAMGFPDDYAFAGNKADVNKQIGNAVPVRLARALIRTMLN